MHRTKTELARKLGLRFFVGRERVLPVGKEIPRHFDNVIANSAAARLQVGGNVWL